MDCPRCKLVNPDTALWCDCGYDFESGYFKQQLPGRSSISDNVVAGFVGGLGIIFLVGLFLLRNWLESLHFVF